MSNILSKDNKFSPTLVSDLINKVKGQSVLQEMSGQEPIPFNGKEQFIFSFDNEIDIVAENGEKGIGGITMEPITVTPVKFEYGARVSEEMWYGTEEEQIDIIKNFNEAFARKIAKGMDMAALFGVNPRTGKKAATINGNSFLDKVAYGGVVGSQIASTDPSEGIDTAINIVNENAEDVTGIIISPELRSYLGAYNDNDGRPLYPEFKFGGSPESLNGTKLKVSSNLQPKNIFIKEATTQTEKWDIDGDSNDQPLSISAIAGDWSMFNWGIAKDIGLRLITAGDPDGQGDLSRKNQIYIRSEVYIGWCIKNPEAFAMTLHAG